MNSIQESLKDWIFNYPNKTLQKGLVDFEK